MFGRLMLVAVVALIFSVNSVHAADVLGKYSVADAMSIEKVKAMFGDDISFYWGDQGHPPVSKNFGSFKTSKRTNALGKSRENACAWAMASALATLQERARKEGGNAVINIVSNLKNREESSATEFSCLAGTVMVNVAIKGTVVTLQK